MHTTHPYIHNLWQQGGPFVGPEGRPHGRVTVQAPWEDGLDYPEWVVRPTMINIGTYAKRGAPLRFFQKADQSQIEIEVPSVKSIQIDRSLDSGAATCHISVLNQHMDPLGTAGSEDELGVPGYYTFDHGKSASTQIRWGHQENPFSYLLYPNSIMRTYQGFGGTEKSIREALEAGNLMLTGVWMIDTVGLSADGTLEIECRDMSKLLIDPMIYAPPIPRQGDLKYPLTYRRWDYVNAPVKAADKTVTVAVPGNKRIAYRNSSSDMYLGPNANVHGHRPTDSIDGNPDTYWLSEGNSNPAKSFCTSYVEFDCDENINAVWMSPWAGNYQLYISVMENGQWIGMDGTIPYDHTPLIGHQPVVVDTGGDIPYVVTSGVPWETPQEYVLPRVFRAQRVRLSFRNHTRSQFGPWYYRVGVREVNLRVSENPATTTVIRSIAFGATPAPTAGYWTINEHDQVDTFGDARELRFNGDEELKGGSTAYTNTIRVKRGGPAPEVPGGDGYWVLQNDGRVRAYGNAVHHGDFKTRGIPVTNNLDVAFELAPTHTGNGYWITTNNGKIYAFGDAPDYVQSISFEDEVMLSSADGHPSAYGLWLVNQRGVVYSYGAAQDLGQPTGFTKVNSIRSTSTGNGYWILDASGSVASFGDAWVNPMPPPAQDPPSDWMEVWWELMPAPDDLGYGIIQGTGKIGFFGSFEWFGDATPGNEAQHRIPGNYEDYSDVIKDLALWAGFMLFEEVAPNETPSVFGSIETTGAYSDADLPLSMFDKRPFIDAMNEIKEIVGYILLVDDDGSLIFSSPNWWAPGNFDEYGIRVPIIPEIDETLQLLSYTATVDDQSLMSEIVIASEDPDQGELSMLSARLVPMTAKGLRGISKPFIWSNGAFQRQQELDVMAELIALQTWFQQRVGNVTAVANPCIQINDQVRVWERITGEAYIHYVRGMSTNHDLQS